MSSAETGIVKIKLAIEIIANINIFLIALSISTSFGSYELYPVLYFKFANAYDVV
jgi:hypothetical protein